jgi:hypothetical protein
MPLEHTNEHSSDLVIWKFTLSNPLTAIDLPSNEVFLSVQAQRDEIVAWFLVDPSQPKVRRILVAYETGVIIPRVEPDIVRRYLGTVQLHAGTYVVHVMEFVKMHGVAIEDGRCFEARP